MLYLCDPAKNAACAATGCAFKSRGGCEATTRPDMAVVTETGEPVLYADWLRRKRLSVQLAQMAGEIGADAARDQIEALSDAIRQIDIQDNRERAAKIAAERRIL